MSTKKIEYYALHRKGFGMLFNCAARTVEGHNIKVQSAYSDWSGHQPKGSDPSMEEYMSGMSKVKVIVEVLE